MRSLRQAWRCSASCRCASRTETSWAFARFMLNYVERDRDNFASFFGEAARRLREEGRIINIAE